MSLRRQRVVVYSCFLLSGTAGLIYEVIWTRLLGLSFGHGEYAVTTVLAVFMGGLALGSYVVGRLSDRASNPLRLYAFLEISIGLSCLFVPALLVVVRKVYLGLYPLMMDLSLAKTLVQFGLTALVLIIPTSLMGGTLPVISRAMVPKIGEVGLRVSQLYGANTLGAAAGAFLSGFCFLPGFGINTTNFVGVTLNLIVGAIVLMVLKPAGSHQPREVMRVGFENRLLRKILLLGFAISGGVAMSYQIAWVRSLVLVIGSSTFAFSSILVSILLGIALGSWLFPLFKSGKSPQFFGKLQIGIAAWVFLLLLLFVWLPNLFLLLFENYRGSYSYIQFIQFFIVALVVLVPSTLMGMTFPCVAGILSNDLGHLGGDIGKFYACNTLGAIIGSFATGFFLIPYVGAQKSLIIGIGLNLLTAFSVFAVLSLQRLKWLVPLFVSIAVLLGIFPQWDREVMVSGVSTYAPIYFLNQKVTPDSSLLTPVKRVDHKILFFKEGIGSTVAVLDRPDQAKSLVINGKADASTSPVDYETQVKLALIPMTLHPDPEKVAVIGFGSGVTAGVCTLYENVKKIDIIELEPAVVEASEYFSDENFRVLENPNVRVYINDGRNFLEGTPETYDVIISEPSNPWIYGIANLFSIEYMEIVKKHLAPGGIFCQWIQGYQISPEDQKMVVRTFLQVFSEASFWVGNKDDYMLVGGNGFLNFINLDDFLSRIEKNSHLTEGLTGLQDQPLQTILMSFLLDAEDLKAYAGPGPINRDDKNFLEFAAPKSLYKDRSVTILTEILAFKTASHPLFLKDPDLQTIRVHEFFGRYLLSTKRLMQAAWEFDRLPSLAPRFEGTLEKILPPGALSRDRYVENFDGGLSFPIFPQVGDFRPEDSQEDLMTAWTAYLDYFSHMSGLVPGSGWNGSVGLALNGIDSVALTGYYAPFAVKPSTTYLLNFKMKSTMRGKDKAGVHVVEYSSFSPSRFQFPKSFDSRHITDSQDRLYLEGSRNWGDYTLKFLTAPTTKMVHLFFFREGRALEGSVVFDNIVVSELKVPRS